MVDLNLKTFSLNYPKMNRHNQHHFNVSITSNNSIHSYRGQQHPPPENQQNPGKTGHRGLWMLIMVHRLAGLSFLGAPVPGESLSISSQFLCIFWNIAVFAFSYYTFYISIIHNRAEPSYADYLETSHAFFGSGQPMSSLIIYLRISALAIYHIFSYLINLYIGTIARPFLALLEAEVLPRLEGREETRIGRLIVLIELILIVVLILILQMLVYIKFGHFLLIRGLEVVINMFSLFAPIALIAYLNLSLAHIIRSATTHQEDLSLYIERLLQVGSIMKRATRLLGPAIIVLIVNSMVVCICTVCLCIANWRNTYFISTWGFLIYALVLVTLVIVSSYAYETSKTTSDAFKQKLLVALCTYKNETHQHLHISSNEPHPVDCHLLSAQLTILSSLEENIRMAPLNLFFLTRSYILTFLAFMLSYSVILVQTSKSTILTVQSLRRNCSMPSG